jgi:hypothetical protein
MNTRYYILILLSIIASNAFSQQRINYTYDAAGNRLSGLSSQLRMATVSGTEEETERQEVYSDQIDQSTIRVYPNPTKGILKVEITQTSEDNPIHIQLYDLSGRILISQPNASTFTELNISDQLAGIYILKVFSDNKDRLWIIIKE